MPELAMTVDQGTLSDAIGALHTLVDECRVHIGDGGLHVAAVEPANSAMVHLDMPDRATESYQADGDHVIGVDLGTLDDIVGLFDGLVNVELDGRDLYLRDGRLEARLATINPDSVRDEPDKPDLDLTALAVVESGEWMRAITAAGVIDTTSLTIIARSDQVRFEVAGDSDDATITLDETDLELLDVDSAAEAMYSLDFLEEITAPMPSDAGVRIEFADEYPIDVSYSVAAGAVSVEYTLAPRIRSD